MIIQPGPVVDFLIANQNAKDPFSLDWAKVCCYFCDLFIFLCNHVLSKGFSTFDQAKRTLKNLRVKTAPANQEFKITGLSEKSCREQTYVCHDLVISCYLQPWHD